MKEADQNFRGEFSLKNIFSAIMETPQINDMNIGTFRDSINNENKTVVSMSNLRKLNVNNVFLKNRLNDIALDSLKEEGLMFRGNQKIKGNMKILQLSTHNVSTHKTLGDFVKITGGSFDIEDGIYLEEFLTKDLIVEKRFNSIPIEKGKMQVLQLDSNTEQTIAGGKMFENVELMGPVNLQGKISKGILERKNPVSMIERPLILKGNKKTILVNLPTAAKTLENQLLFTKTLFNDSNYVVIIIIVWSYGVNGFDFQTLLL